MHKFILLLAVILLGLALFIGHGEAAKAEVIQTEAPSADSTPVPTEETDDYEGDASTYYIDVAYSQQIQRYKTALTEKWSEEQYLENELSTLPAHYYEGNPLENVGFGFADLDNDGHWELIIGGILNAEKDPTVFEIWTLVDGNPVMLVQGGIRNRYILQYEEENRLWIIANEASSGAANSATYYLMLKEGKLEVIQGLVFDATVDEKNPWYLTYDLDEDVSNDQPIDEETALGIMESYSKFNIALEYFPYSFY